MTEQMLRQYTVLVEYLGATLGPDYEVVLHEILPETRAKTGGTPPASLPLPMAPSAAAASARRSQTRRCA